jgi:glycerol kinase
MQFQSDLLRAKVIRPKITETTALGAAYLAGIAVKFWTGIDEIKKQWQLDKTFSPVMPAEEAEVYIKGWHRAVKAAEVWADGSE